MHHISHLCTPPCSALVSVLTWRIYLLVHLSASHGNPDYLGEILFQLWVGSLLICPHPFLLLIHLLLFAFSAIFWTFLHSDSLRKFITLKTKVIYDGFMPSSASLPTLHPPNFTPPGLIFSVVVFFFIVANVLQPSPLSLYYSKG